VTSPAAPLAGVRVLSLAEQYPGPFATMLLADLGADVVLVERPGGGDPTRRFSGHFEALNRNKRSIALDLKHPGGAEVFWRIAAAADVVVEGFKPGTAERLGVGPAAARGRRPELIYTSISSFGQTGPLGPRGGHDLSMQGIAGFVTGDPPRPVSLPLADLSSAMFAAVGILAALLRRERSGDGATLDVSMLDSLIAWRATALVSAVNGLSPAPYPPDDPGYNVFVNSAGEAVTLSIAGEDHQWHALCLALGLDELASLDTPAREGDAEEIGRRVADAFAKVPWPELSAALSAGGVGFGPVSALEDIPGHPQVAARAMFVPVPGAGDLRVVRQPVLFDGSGGTVRVRAPRLGQDSVLVLNEAGFTRTEIEHLVTSGVVAAAEGGTHE
jgi:crotonobetainyl-CoA:carnitine CoA-transferase CaiB-like acyl-CoA transferase